MAKLRVFVSSTYFDLKVIRSELWRFITDHGYDPVEHEQNQIPWGESKKLEEYCYDEIALCDMLISVVGGRYGAAATKHEGSSISQAELKAAQRLGKQVYIFVERDILAEHKTWRLNRENIATKYASVDDPRIYAFLELMYSLPKNNPVFPFITGEDITKALKEQWAGLFQKLLVKEAEESQRQLLNELRNTANELKAVTKDLQQALGLIAKIPSNRTFGASALPKAIRNALKLTFEPSLDTFEELDSFLFDNGYVFAKTDENSTVRYRFYVGQDANLFISCDLWDSAHKIITIDPAEWDTRYVMRVSTDTTELPPPPKKKDEFSIAHDATS